MTEAEKKIKALAPEDTPAVAGIVASGYAFLAEKQGFSRSQLQELLTTRCSEACIRGWFDRWKSLVAAIDGRVVGTVAYCGNCIEELWILPECHGTGLGGTLFRCAQHDMETAGESVLVVRTTGYATGFYENMGAVVVGARICPAGPLKGWTLTCLEMSLR